MGDIRRSGVRMATSSNRRRIQDPDSYRWAAGVGGRSAAGADDGSGCGPTPTSGPHRSLLTQKGGSPAVRAGDETPERAETLAYISRWPARAEDVD